MHTELPLFNPDKQPREIHSRTSGLTATSLSSSPHNGEDDFKRTGLVHMTPGSDKAGESRVHERVAKDARDVEAACEILKTDTIEMWLFQRVEM
jgi:hypothetical protein